MICQCSISMEAFSKHLSGTVLDRSYPAIPWQGQQLPNNVFSQVRPFNSITLTIVSATLSSSRDLSRILNKMQTIFRAWFFKSCSLTHSFPFFEFAGSSQVQPDFHFHFSAPQFHANSVESSGGNQTTVLSGQKTQSVPFQLSTATNYFLQSISLNPPPGHSSSPFLPPCCQLDGWAELRLHLEQRPQVYCFVFFTVFSWDISYTLSLLEDLRIHQVQQDPEGPHNNTREKNNKTIF